MKRLLAVALIVLAAGCGSSTKASTSSGDTPTTAGVDSSSTNDKNPPAADVTITKCEPGPLPSIPTVEMDVVNHSSKRSNYLIQFQILDANGVKVGDGNASSQNVDPGQTAKTTGLSVLTGSTASFTCKLAKVDRYAV